MNDNFNGIWIPNFILKLETLGWTEKLILSEIIILSKNGDCHANNNHFSKILGISKDRVSKVINKLIKLKYLNSKIIYKAGTKIVDKRILSLNMQRYPQGICKDVLYPPAQNAEEREQEIKKINNSHSFHEAKKKNTKKQVFHEKSEPYMLSRFLEEQIQKHTPEFKTDETRRQRWAKDIDLMIRQDNLDPDKIADVIVWAHKNTFWRANILSGKKLREKYLQLSIQMKDN